MYRLFCSKGIFLNTFRIFILLHIKRHYFIHFLLIFKIVKNLQCIPEPVAGDIVGTFKNLYLIHFKNRYQRFNYYFNDIDIAFGALPFSYSVLTLLKMGLFGLQKAPLPKICHTYSTMIKVGTGIPCLEKIQKSFKSYDTPHLSSADTSIFPGMRNFCYFKKYRDGFHFNT